MTYEPPLVYIAGPYSGRDYFDIDSHINTAAEMAARLARAGIPYFCPHLNSAHFEVITPDVPPEFWYEMDLIVLRRCQALILLPEYYTSHGSNRELEEAERLHIPAFFTFKDLKKWVDKTREMDEREEARLLFAGS